LGRQEAKFFQMQATMHATHQQHMALNYQLMDVAQTIKTLRDAKLEINMNDELDEMSNCEFEVDEHANFEVVSLVECKVKANEDFKFT
jgi:hypothetical protein